jgi:glucose-6-phosphate 1-dehydrogenase
MCKSPSPKATAWGIGGAITTQRGALRDMVPNHLFQLLTLVAMEPPIALDADAVRDEKLRVLRSLKPFEPDEVDQCVVRGQYDAGEINGAKVPAYRDEPFVHPQSATETFVALRLFVHNWRWEACPFTCGRASGCPNASPKCTSNFVPSRHLLFPPERRGN